MERFEYGSDMCGYRSLISSTSKAILNNEPVKLTLWQVAIERVIVFSFE